MYLHGSITVIAEQLPVFAVFIPWEVGKCWYFHGADRELNHAGEATGMSALSEGSGQKCYPPKWVCCSHLRAGTGPCQSSRSLGYTWHAPASHEASPVASLSGEACAEWAGLWHSLTLSLSGMDVPSDLPTVAGGVGQHREVNAHLLSPGLVAKPPGKVSSPANKGRSRLTYLWTALGSGCFSSLVYQDKLLCSNKASDAQGLAGTVSILPALFGCLSQVRWRKRLSLLVEQCKASLCCSVG